jgi:hypothetical protein
VPEPPKDFILNSEMEEEDTEKTWLHKEPTDPDFQGPASESPHKLTQNELNDLVGDWELPKVKPELLTSRMKQCQKDMATFWVLIWTSFRRTVVLWVMSTVNVSGRTLQQWRADTKEHGAH